jgi:hypothetical protein
MTSLETVDHDINCKLCNNNMIDFDPTETLALFQQQELVEQFKVQGTFNMDEIAVSFLSGTTLQIYSRIELLDFAEDFYELIVRQEGTTTDLLKYKACNILGVFTKGAGNTQVRYHQGSDFEVDINGSINWTGAHKPADRQVYSVYYKHHPVYRAIKAIHIDRYSQRNIRPNQIQAPKKEVDGRTYVKLPEQWILKRDYLIERRDINGTTLPPQEDYDPNA